MMWRKDTFCPKRYGSLVFCLEDDVFVVGGAGYCMTHGVSSNMSVIWKYNTRRRQWKKRAVVDGSLFPKAMRHAVGVLVGHEFYVYGGEQTLQSPGELSAADRRHYKSLRERDEADIVSHGLWKLVVHTDDSCSWQEVVYEDRRIPAPRTRSIGWHYGGRVWYFGGQIVKEQEYGTTYLSRHGEMVPMTEVEHDDDNDDMVERFLTNQMLCFDVASRSFSDVVCAGAVPSARHGHCSAVIGDTVIVYGGFDGLDDMYEFNMHTLHWTNITAEVRPPGRGQASLTAVTNDLLFLYHGTEKDDDLQPRRDGWTFVRSSKSWSKRQVADIDQEQHAAIATSQGIMTVGGDGSLIACSPEVYNNNFISLSPQSLKSLALACVCKQSIQWLELPLYFRKTLEMI